MCSSPKTNHRKIKNRATYSNTALSAQQYSSYARVANEAYERRERIKHQQETSIREVEMLSNNKTNQHGWQYWLFSFDLFQLLKAT